MSFFFKALAWCCYHNVRNLTVSGALLAQCSPGTSIFFRRAEKFGDAEALVDIPIHSEPTIAFSGLQQLQPLGSIFVEAIGLSATRRVLTIFPFDIKPLERTQANILFKYSCHFALEFFIASLVDAHSNRNGADIVATMILPYELRAFGKLD